MTAQQAFFRMYILAKPYPVRKGIWPWVIGKTGATDFTGDPQGITDEVIQANAKSLIQQGFKLDEEIDVWNWDPYTTMLVRINNGIAWVPAAENGGGVGDIIVAGQNSGPVPPGAIPVTLDPAAYPAIPDPSPDTPTPPAPISRASNPVGKLIMASGAPNGVGSLFRCAYPKAVNGVIVQDGYVDGDTWTGTVLGFTGEFTRESRMMLECFEKTK